jgi:hypothetical protein
VTKLHICDSFARIVAVVTRRQQIDGNSTNSVPVQSILLFSLTGARLSSVDCRPYVITTALTRNSEFVLCGDARGNLSVLSLGDLSVVVNYKPNVSNGASGTPIADSVSNIQALAMTEDDRHVICGCEMAPLLVRVFFPLFSA